MASQEKKRINAPKTDTIQPWKKWGPYVSDRAWGTVREDYSADGDAWRYSTHDMARSMAYRWSEDAIAGWCDQYQTIVFSLAFWNSKDPILKERLFGLNPYEGNHAEDVKEYYFYLDGTPTHSYMKFLYKYPQAAFPYQRLIEENQKRGPHDREFELLDTGVFQDNRYFDIFVEYAKADPEDTIIRVEVCNRGPEAASIHVVPHLLFRNRWSWEAKGFEVKPNIQEGPAGKGFISLYADPSNLPPVENVPFEYKLDPLYLYAASGCEVLFTENESNLQRLYNATNASPYVKDAFHRSIIHKEQGVLNPEREGTKAALHFQGQIPAGESKILYFRLTPRKEKNPLADAESIINMRKKEADEFYQEIQAGLPEDDKLIQRQAIAGMLWSKQFFRYDVSRWLRGDDPYPPPPASRAEIRNNHWRHLKANSIISMPDKWEYPWFAAWDLAFHCIALGLVDMDLAKHQLHLLLNYHYQHPNGQIPAYEWGFSDLNPPVQAWAAWRLFCMDGKKDFDFLELMFNKLITNFNWWVNKVDKEGNNFFEGGFLGLDNISIIDRSKPLPNGGHFEESDGTGWMGFFALYMMRIALELSRTGKHHFGELATVYFEHFVYITYALQGALRRKQGMWDEEDGFMYDVISYPDKSQHRLKIRSFVGIIPFYSFDYLDEEDIEQLPFFRNAFHLFMKEYPDRCQLAVRTIPTNGKKRYIFSLLSPEQMDRAFEKIWDSEEFYSPYGLRSLSKFHERCPYQFGGNTVTYEPGESLERIKGGNSNWRGPVWFPTNFLVLESLIRMQKAFGDNLPIKTPKGSIPIKQQIDSFRNRLIDLFRKRKSDQKRPAHGDYDIFNTDPYWKDLILFYEHYHGDTGRGLGASHQTGWSGLVAALIAEQFK